MRIELRRFSKKIGTTQAQIKLKFDVNLSDHAEQRTSQRGVEEKEILTALNRAGEKIIKGIVNNDINVNTRDRFIVQDGERNIVCGAKKDSESSNVVTITVITCAKYGDKFNNENDTYLIKV